MKIATVFFIGGCGPNDADDGQANDAGGGSNAEATGTADADGSTAAATAGGAGPGDATTAGGPTTAGDTGGVCGLVPQQSPPFNRGAFACCFGDSDCGEGTVCFSATCQEDGEGICVGAPNGKNTCWANSDCTPAQQCVGAAAHCDCTDLCGVYADSGQCEDM